MTHAAFECAAPFTAVGFREKFKIAYRRYVKYRGDCLLLLAFVRHAGRNSL